MFIEIYSIFDHATKAYMQPFFTNNRATAIRNFQATVNPDSPNMISGNPEQFTLFYLGKYDDSTGTIENCPTPEPVMKALDVHEPQLNRDSVMETLQLLVDKVTKLENLQ